MGNLPAYHASLFLDIIETQTVFFAYQDQRFYWGGVTITGPNPDHMRKFQLVRMT
jgi:hypothetical protein